jgi:hypothetical protein
VTARPAIAPPSLQIDGLQAALRACRLIGARRGLAIISAPGAAAYLGGGYWAALSALVAEAVADPPLLILDCGPLAGPALDAIAAGCTYLVCHSPPADLLSFAAAASVTVYQDRGPCLAISDRRPSDAEVTAFLCQHP